MKAQLVAFLTKKVRPSLPLLSPHYADCSLSIPFFPPSCFPSLQLLDSKLFVGAVHALHDNVTKVQQGAYDTLLQATGLSPFLPILPLFLPNFDPYSACALRRGLGPQTPPSAPEARSEDGDAQAKNGGTAQGSER